jgi:hypothetical protein
MNWRERKDIPWIVGAAVLVIVLIVVFSFWNGTAP